MKHEVTVSSWFPIKGYRIIWIPGAHLVLMPDNAVPFDTTSHSRGIPHENNNPREDSSGTLNPICICVVCTWLRDWTGGWSANSHQMLDWLNGTARIVLDFRYPRTRIALLLPHFCHWHRSRHPDSLLIQHRMKDADEVTVAHSPTLPTTAIN